MEENSNKRVAKNTLFLYFRMILLMGINLYTSRIVLDVLGINDYGIYNIVGGIIALFSFISGAMISATQRYLNYYMESDDDTMLNKVFSASLIIHIIIAIIIIFTAETLGLWLLLEKLVVPLNRHIAAFWTYQCAIISSTLLLISYPYNATIVAHEKMGAYAYVSVIEAVLKLLIVFVLEVSGFDKLIIYAILLMLVQMITTLIYIIYCRQKFKETVLRLRGISFKLYKELVSFSGWNFLGNIANVCLTQGTNLLLNLFFGPAVNAAKGISVQVQNAVGAFCTNFQMAQNPQIVKLYASGDYSELHKIVFRASRFSYYLALIFCIPIIIESENLLNIWLKNPPKYTSVFVQYTMIFILIQALANPLLTASLATGKIKRIMCIIATLLMLVIPLGYFFLSIGYSPISVFQVQLLIYFIAHVLRVYIVSKQIGFSIVQYIRQVIMPVFVVTLASYLLAIAFPLLFDNSMWSTIIICIITALLSVCIAITFGMQNNERVFIINIINKKIKKNDD